MCVRVRVTYQRKRDDGFNSGGRGVDGASDGGPVCDDEVLVRVVCDEDEGK